MAESLQDLKKHRDTIKRKLTLLGKFIQSAQLTIQNLKSQNTLPSKKLLIDIESRL